MNIDISQDGKKYAEENAGESHPRVTSAAFKMTLGSQHGLLQWGDPAQLDNCAMLIAIMPFALEALSRQGWGLLIFYNEQFAVLPCCLRQSLG